MKTLNDEILHLHRAKRKKKRSNVYIYGTATVMYIISL